MRPLLLFVLLLPIFATSQVIVYDNEMFLEFTLLSPEDSISATGIDWKKEKLISEFTLSGSRSLRYSLTLKNDTIAILSRYNNRKWELQEEIAYTDWAVSRIEEAKVISEFKITDFDNDGDEDLICWTSTNINGNMWTVIFLNDQRQQKLVKLYNLADDTDIWNRPEFDIETGIINCTLESGVFGISSESSYKLNGSVAEPIQKHEFDSTNDKNVYELEFMGENGTWKQTSQTVDIGIDGKKQLLYYSLEQENDSIITLNKYNGIDRQEYIMQATFSYPGWATPYDETKLDIPSYQFIDFNKDGNEDLLFYTGTNVHGVINTLIFLNDQQHKKLVQLMNTAENSEIWDAPEYNPETRIITCTHPSGNAGLSFTSTYKLKSFNAKPLKKTEQDYTNVNWQTGEGYLENEYKGKRGKWKLN
jgi:hypothetical protein